MERPGELVVSAGCDNGDSFGKRDTQYQEIATADTLVQNRSAPVISLSSSLGVAGGLETEGSSFLVGGMSFAGGVPTDVAAACALPGWLIPFAVT
jgi:hypothetical protein